jgi:hypothetical protein
MGAALPLVVGVLLVPSRAHAGCDNFAFARTSAANDMAADGMTHHDPGQPFKPCSGPNCSRGSDPVPLVPVFLSPSTGDHWLWVAPLRLTPDVGDGGLLGDGPSARALRRSDPIEPPPRLSVSPSFSL